MTSLARPLKAQTVNKGKVWLVFVLGAAGLFGAAVLLENNERFFPAISRANKAMAATRKAGQARARACHCLWRRKPKEWKRCVKAFARLVLSVPRCPSVAEPKSVSAQAKEEQEAAIEAELAQQQRLQGAVEAGLAEARQRAVTPSAPAPVAPARASEPSDAPDLHGRDAAAGASNVARASRNGVGDSGHAEAAEGAWSSDACLGPEAAEAAAGRQSGGASSQRGDGSVLREVQSGRGNDSSA